MSEERQLDLSERRSFRRRMSWALATYFTSIGLTAIGLGWSPDRDVFLHGFVPMTIGIVGLYLLQDAAVFEVSKGASPRGIHSFLLLIGTVILAVASNCACDLGRVKRIIVVITAIIICLVWFVRNAIVLGKRNQKTNS